SRSARASHGLAQRLGAPPVAWGSSTAWDSATGRAARVPGVLEEVLLGHLGFGSVAVYGVADEDGMEDARGGHADAGTRSEQPRGVRGVRHRADGAMYVHVRAREFGHRRRQTRHPAVACDDRLRRS